MLGAQKSPFSFVVSVLAVTTLFAFTGCGSSSSPQNPGGGAPQATIAFDAQPATINQGQSTTISWQATNASTVSISPSVLPAGQAYPMSGTAQVSPSQTTTYTATATDASGRVVASSVTVTVVPANSTPSITLSISPQVVAAGQTATITWQSANATSVTITPSILSEDTTALALSGSDVIVPTATTTYKAVATGAGGATAQATATVSMMTVSLTASPSTIAAGQSATLTWNSSPANGTSVSIDQGIGPQTAPSGSITVSPDATTIYTITATNGTAIATAQATLNAPLSVTLTAKPANITPGQQSTLTWNARGATSLTIDNGIGSETGAQGSVPVSPTQTTTYTITAADAGGHTTTAAATVTVSTNTGLQTIKHIIFMLQENRSFDGYFGQLQAYASQKVPGYQINAGYDPTILLPLIGGGTGHPFHEPTVQTENLTPSWNESHFDIDQQKDGSFKMDRFALTGNSVTHNFDAHGLRALGFYDQTDLPYYYELATQFATSDAFHSSLLANTVPNRQFMFCATSQGRIFPSPAGHPQWTCPTIFSSLQNAGIKWGYYYSSGILLAQFTDWNNPAIATRTSRIQNLFNVLASPTADQDLPSVVFIENGDDPNAPPGTKPRDFDEHPDANIQLGAAYVKSIIDALMASPAWHDSVFILGYDEGGGLYDHVPPFTVAAPDSTPPALRPGDMPGDFTLSGFRVPLTVVSPWVKPHFVSHTNRELTSILKLIETRFGLPPLTARDAAADDMTEFFDFVNGPALLTPPPLPAQPTNGLADQTKEAPPQ
ncbi:MAG TPA: alkaline phosphatase family protein [Terriglobales bacterium]|nr:alkaline phosphatase family protein [Terriglobales bacterium]